MAAGVKGYCRNCSYYISDAAMNKDPYYKDYDNKLGYDGLCNNTDT